MSRPDVRMSDAEIAAFLDVTTEVVVVGLGGDGPPAGTVGRLGRSGGVLRVEVAVDDPLVAALAADPRVCLVAESFPTYDEIRGVQVHGRCRPVGAATGTVAYEVDVDSVVSFDFGKAAAGRSARRGEVAQQVEGPRP